MKKIAKFEKVSFEQFKNDYYRSNWGMFSPDANLDDDGLLRLYNEIIIPKRKTKFSAGYDFHMPFTVEIHKDESVTVPTGIRCLIEDNYVLQIYPRSSLGFKYGIILSNTVGIIDSDYYDAKNEGHIMIKIVNKGDKTVLLNKGNGFCQGLFVEYGITFDDATNETRSGGIGSTDRQ